MRFVMCTVAIVGCLSVSPSVLAWNKCVKPPDGMVAWWAGDGNAKDIIGGLDGTPQNGASFAPGYVRKAFSLNGQGALVSVPSSPSLNFGPRSPISVDLWAYRTSFASTMHLVGKRLDCSDLNYQMALNTDSGEGLVFGAGFGNEVATGRDLPLKQWTHLAGTFNGSSYRFYINGQLAATAQGTLGPANTVPLTIGNSGDCEPFGGLIDEVEIFERALSASEIKSIYDAGRAGKCLPIRGSVNGIELEDVKCQVARRPPTRGVITREASWDCTKAGLVAEPGQKVEIRLKGDASETDIHKKCERD